jgi:hypothetical protein
MQQKIQSSKPCSPEVPTQSDINAIVGATQLLEGQNSVLSQMVYRCYPRTLWEAISEEFGKQSLSVLICLYGRTSTFVQSVGGIC